MGGFSEGIKKEELERIKEELERMFGIIIVILGRTFTIMEYT